jgi:hypothetical protein
MRKLALCTGILAALTAAGGAHAAAWPTSVQGKWGGPANTSNMQYNITIQKPGGACPIIYGVITDLTYNSVSSLSGFYCPGSGRIVFMRQDNTTGRVFQVYRGNVSQASADHLLVIGGTMIDYGQNQKIEFPFAAQK